MTTANVIDMFHGDNREAVPDFAKLVVDGIIAVIHKVGQGHTIDPHFADRGAAAGRVEMPFYGYWFNDGSDPVVQARNCSKFAALVPTCLGWCLDFEDLPGNNMTFDAAVAFLNAADSLQGFKTPIYGSNRVREQISPQKAYATFFSPRLLWLAEYGPKENVPAPWVSSVKTLWQFSESGNEAGISGHVDLNIWPGTAAELKAAWQAKS